MSPLPRDGNGGSLVRLFDRRRTIRLRCRTPSLNSNSMHRTRLALLVAAVVLPSTITAQSPRRIHDEQSTWFAYTGVHPISPLWRLQLEGQVRQTERASHPQQRLFRTALLRVLTPAARVG